jgi:hypothetical protein
MSKISNPTDKGTVTKNNVFGTKTELTVAICKMFNNHANVSYSLPLHYLAPFICIKN